MTMKRVWMGMVGAAVLLVPPAVFGQMDPSSTSPNPNNGSPTTNPMGGTPVQPGMGNPTGGSTSGSMRDSLGAPGTTGQQMLDKQFVQKAAAGGLAEVKLGTLATQKGGAEVKAFGQKMVDDHTAIDKDMASVADTLGVMLPKKMTKDDQAEYDKLSALSGDDFDKEYILFMAKAHRQDLREFREEASIAADPGLQTEVVKAAMVIREHLMMVTKLAGDKGVTLPPRPPRPAPPAGQ